MGCAFIEMVLLTLLLLRIRYMRHYIVIMWEIDARNGISAIISDIRRLETPNWEDLSRRVMKLHREIGSRCKEIAEGDNPSYIDEKIANVRHELERLNDALLANDVHTSIKHAEAALWATG